MKCFPTMEQKLIDNVLAKETGKLFSNHGD